jgi:hypothetical protein
MEYVAVITAPGVFVVAGAWYSPNVCGFKFTPNQPLSSPAGGVFNSMEYWISYAYRIASVPP